jgi:DNA-binding FadR family transcriptional regulator
MDRPLRLISTNPVDQLARTVEALLVVASQPLSGEELAAAADDDRERVETALGLLRERYREGRSGIVLEHVAGGWAFRASREAAAAGDRHGYETENRHFHDALYEGCGNPVIVEQVRQLRLRLAAFRRRVRDQPGRLQSAAMEHDAVVTAIVGNDAERAAQAMREHIIAKGRAFADMLLAPAHAPAEAARR